MIRHVQVSYQCHLHRSIKILSLDKESTGKGWLQQRGDHPASKGSKADLRGQSQGASQYPRYPQGILVKHLKTWGYCELFGCFIFDVYQLLSLLFFFFLKCACKNYLVCIDLTIQRRAFSGSLNVGLRQEIADTLKIMFSLLAFWFFIFFLVAVPILALHVL